MISQMRRKTLLFITNQQKDGHYHTRISTFFDKIDYSKIFTVATQYANYLFLGLIALFIANIFSLVIFDLSILFFGILISKFSQFDNFGSNASNYTFGPPKVMDYALAVPTFQNSRFLRTKSAKKKTMILREQKGN